VDLASGGVAVDTFSVRLSADASFDYDYPQFVPDNGSEMSGSNARPWRIVAEGLQGRYTAADDQFAAMVRLQYAKRVDTDAVTVAVPAASASASASSSSLADALRMGLAGSRPVA